MTVIWHASLRDVCVESMIARVSPYLGREYPPGEWSGIGQFPDVIVDTSSENSWELRYPPESDFVKLSKHVR